MVCPRSILPSLSSCIQHLSSGCIPCWCRDEYTSGLPYEKSHMQKIPPAKRTMFCFSSGRCVQVVHVRSEHTAFRGTSISFLFSSWHLPKVLIRKSAIRACSGASTLKDQYLGQVPGGRKKKEEKKKGRNPFWSRELLERCKSAKKIGESLALSQRPKEFVGGGRIHFSTSSHHLKKNPWCRAKPERKHR